MLAHLGTVEMASDQRLHNIFTWPAGHLAMRCFTVGPVMKEGP